MRRLPLVLVAVALLAVPAKAHAATTRCSGHRYGLISSHAFPAIRRLRAHGLPRRTDGYAPRCLVAEAVAGLVQSRWGKDDASVPAPTRVHPRGARWDGGIWRLRYRVVTGEVDGTHAEITGRHGHRRITFAGYS